MEIKRNDPCPCGSGKKYKKCCAVEPAFSPEPKHASHYVVQGNNMQERGNLKQALKLHHEALSIDPGYAMAHFNIGGILRELGQIEEAAASYEKVLSLDPEDMEVTVILGSLYAKIGRNNEADACYKKASSFKTNSAEAYVNFGIFLTNFGRMEEACSCYTKALLIKPAYPEAYCNQGDALLLQGLTKEAVASFQEAHFLQPDYPKAQIFLAICAWISADVTSCIRYLDLTKNSSSFIDKYEMEFIWPYFHFLNRLTKYREKNQQLYTSDKDIPILYVIGDSHSLAMSNIKIDFKGSYYQTMAKLIIGCKAWHLGNSETNKYKYAFEKLIASIPAGSTVAINIGEIDCRLNEGIIRNHINTNSNLTESISSLVGNYIRYISNECRTRSIEPLVCNIPVRLIGEDKISSSEKEMLEIVLKKFNQALADNCTIKQIQLLDVNALSKNDDGTPKDEYHLDNFHLLPSFYEYLIRKSHPIN